MLIGKKGLQEHANFISVCDPTKADLLLHLAQLLQNLLCVLRLGTVVSRQMGRQSLQWTCSPHTLSSAAQAAQRGSKADEVQVAHSSSSDSTSTTK